MIEWLGSILVLVVIGVIIWIFYKQKETINFYDEYGKYLIKNKYPYIKDFIDNVIISKINNPGKLDLNNELSKFITENKPKVKKLQFIYNNIIY